MLLIAAVAGCTTTTAAARSETPDSIDGAEIARIRAEGPAALDRLYT